MNADQHAKRVIHTIRNVLQHELIGLDCEVINAANKANIGIKGKIVDETMKTIVIHGDNGNKFVFKKGSKFRVAVDSKKLIIEGDQLVTRPEDRIKKKIRKW